MRNFILFLFAASFLFPDVFSIQVDYVFYKEPIDVVIPCAQKDVSALKFCIDGVRRNVKNVRRIIVVSSEPFTDQAEWFDETLYPFTRSDLGVHVLNIATPVRGWIYQQCLKFYAPFVIPGISSNVLIVDSDVIFFRPVEFLTDRNAGLYNPGDEYHLPYFSHMEKLLPGLKKVYPNYSGISHHMLFQRSVLEDLFYQVETVHRVPFWQALCHSIDIKEYADSCMSEYEIYFNFVFSRTDQVKLRFLKWENKGIDSIEELIYSKRQRLNYAVYHNYSR